MVSPAPHPRPQHQRCARPLPTLLSSWWHIWSSRRMTGLSRETWDGLEFPANSPLPSALGGGHPIKPTPKVSCFSLALSPGTSLPHSALCELFHFVSTKASRRGKEN